MFRDEVDMKSYTLKDACYITTGKLDANQSIKNGIYPFFTCAEFPDAINTYAFDCDAVLVAGNNARGNFHVNRYKGKFNAYQRTYVLTSKENFDIDFIFYSLKLELKRLKEKSQGSQTKFLTLPILQNIHFSSILINEQKSIAAVLSALDKKIALNKQINARLEEMAKTLYDYWFVQFDFPDAKGKPYKSSGGEMVFDETLKREIPKGWEVKSLKDVLVNCSDNIKSEDLTSNMPYTPIDSLPMRKMTFSDFQKIENARTSLIRYSFNDILIGAMRVYFHRVCIAPFDGITRSTTIVLKPKKQNHLPFLYQLCNEEKTINFASKVSIGTQQPYVNWVNGLAEYKFAMPNLELIEKYSIKIMPLIKSVIAREKQNYQLTQLRDFLLPMLINGQVSVAE